MPNGDPREGFFFPSLTLMTDSYVLFTFCLPEYLGIVSQHKFIRSLNKITIIQQSIEENITEPLKIGHCDLDL